MTRFPCRALLGLALAGCAATAPPPEGPPLVWPEAPDAPRVVFVKSIARPDDLGIEKSLLERIGEWVLGASEKRILRPMAVVASKGVIYVADPGVKGVHRFDTVAGRYDVIRGEAEMPLLSPVGLARGPDGEVYVADSALARVLVIRPGAASAQPLALPKLQQPTGIAFDPVGGRLIVVDTKAHALRSFARDGAPGESWGRRGTGPAEFNYPTQIWRDAAGRLYVTDTLNFRIQILDAQGRFLARFGRAGDGAGDFMRHKGLATDSFGHVYVVDALLHSIQVFDRKGVLLLSVGDMGRGRGEFWLPAGLFIDEDDTIYVADTYNQRIQVFRYVGGPT
jgi:DNA-binding beta-propeller fold protein YncE